MSLCPECGKVYCDHTPEERKQNRAEMRAMLRPVEILAFQSDDEVRKKRVALETRSSQMRARDKTTRWRCNHGQYNW